MQFIKISILLLMLLLSLPLVSADSEYYEDVDVLIIGRCRSVFSFPQPLHVGELEYCGVGVEGSPLERVFILVSGCRPKRLDYHLIFMRDSNGIYIWGQVFPFSVRYVPPFVFVLCHADRLWITEGTT